MLIFPVSEKPFSFRCVLLSDKCKSGIQEYFLKKLIKKRVGQI